MKTQNSILHRNLILSIFRSSSRCAFGITCSKMEEFPGLGIFLQKFFQILRINLLVAPNAYLNEKHYLII